MSKQITMTVADVLYEALQHEGKELDQAPGEVLKDGLMIAYKSDAGWTLKLRPVTKASVDPCQPELLLATTPAPATLERP